MLKTARALRAVDGELLARLRGFAAVPAVAKAGLTPFTKFGSPVPQDNQGPFYNKALGLIPECEVSTLSNGLRVATETIPWATTATVAVTIDTGSRYEERHTNGVAHFLEHLNFKGTGRRSRSQIEVEVENLGGQLHAFTSREQTCYWVKAERSAVPALVDVVADMLTGSQYEQRSVDAERSVITTEMEHVYQQPHEVVFDHLHATAFQNTGLGFTILGPRENIMAISSGDVKTFVKEHYTGPRMVLSGVGAITHEELVKLGQAHLGGVPSEGASTAQQLAKKPGFFTGSDVRIREPDEASCHFAVAVEGCSHNDPDFVALELMRMMLGDWDASSSVGINSGSHLAQKVAAGGWADRVFAFNTAYHDTGLFGVYASGPAAHTKDLSWAVMKHLSGLSYSVSDVDLVRAKNMLKAERLSYYKNSESVATDIGAQLAKHNRRVPMDEMFARIDRTTAEDVKRAAQRFVYDAEVAIAAYGETFDLPDYIWFRRRTYQLRY
ncbi:unnamed protein product [Pedinophyceae sp. YPF-701]|nr:unnamed protein product [Pedinophyceae sp. YPF-701]